MRNQEPKNQKLDKGIPAQKKSFVELTEAQLEKVSGGTGVTGGASGGTPVKSGWDLNSNKKV